MQPVDLVPNATDQPKEMRECTSTLNVRWCGGEAVGRPPREIGSLLTTGALVGQHDKWQNQKLSKKGVPPLGAAMIEKRAGRILVAVSVASFYLSLFWNRIQELCAASYFPLAIKLSAEPALK